MADAEDRRPPTAAERRFDRVRALEPGLSAVLPARQQLCRAVDSALGLPVHGPSSRHVCAKPVVAWPRNAVRLHAGGSGGVPPHGRSHLDREADTRRRAADGTRSALGGRPRAGADALRHRGRSRQCGVSDGRRHRDRHPHRAEPEPAQLLLHRVAVAARPRRACVSSCTSGHVALAGTREPAGRTRCRSVHHGRDGRAGDPDVHQQRHSGCEGNAAPGGRKARAGRRARLACGRPAAGHPGSHCRGRVARRRGPRRTALPLAAVADVRHTDRLGPARGLRLDCRLSRAARICRASASWTNCSRCMR